MLKEFKEFISRGNLVELAVAVILGLAFNSVVQAVVLGVFTPLIGAIFGRPDLTSLGFRVGDARIQIGFVLDTAITFLITAFVLFLVIKAYNRTFPEEEEPAGPTEIDLLTEIRDGLRRR
jgi:large conductance mechanosensitive channel